MNKIVNVKNYSQHIWPITVVILYSIYFYTIEKILFINGWEISLRDITNNNIGIKLITDFVVMLIFPVMLCIIYRKRLNELGVVKSKISLILLFIYFIFFFMHGDFSTSGCYKAFFYIFIIAAPEEIIYRGYLFSRLKSFNRLIAILVSGSLWGIMHAILPGILAGNDLLTILLSMLNEIGGGIIGGLFFICLFEYSGSLLVAIMVHALLDYSYESWGIIVGLVVFTYLVLASKKEIIADKNNG